MRQTNKTRLLLILDGWGVSRDQTANAIASAHTPCWDALQRKYPYTELSSSGDDVGLPAGQMGNSEVGHLHIGNGRLIRQDLSLINHAISSGEFDNNPVFNAVLDDVNQYHSTLHIFGLLSDGGVHSHEHHIHALIKLAQRKGVKRVLIHAFLDGRDCPPQSAERSLKELQTLCTGLRLGEIASISGRYYAMDRDKRWDRIEKCFNLLVHGRTELIYADPISALNAAYARGETDEFVQPTAITSTSAATIKAGDSVIFMNFRSDRARQLTESFIATDFDHFDRGIMPALRHFVSLTQYSKKLATEIAFPPLAINNGLGECLARAHYTQLRIAETEKYAHVTFFFNGGREEPFAGEDRCLINSPKVATYDLQPEMSAIELTDKLVAAIMNKTYDVIICNYANADMVGHTGNFAAACRAIEVLDQCLARIEAALIATDSEALLTADHGNAECMEDPDTHQPHTAHTSLPVPLVYITKQSAYQFRAQPGTLADIAPTLMTLLQLPIPAEMTGENLLTLRNR